MHPCPRTGIDGKSDVALQFSSQALSTTSDLQAFLTAVEQPLGLKLSAGIAPVEFVVYDVRVREPEQHSFVIAPCRCSFALMSALFGAGGSRPLNNGRVYMRVVTFMAL